jgi:hypothetical protein
MRTHQEFLFNQTITETLNPNNLVTRSEFTFFTRTNHLQNFSQDRKYLFTLLILAMSDYVFAAIVNSKKNIKQFHCKVIRTYLMSYYNLAPSIKIYFLFKHNFTRRWIWHFLMLTIK